MSIRTEIDRITIAKTYIISAVEGKGVTVPVGTKIEDLPALIDNINIVDVQPLSVTANGTYTAPSGVAYSPVSVSVSVEASNFYTGTGTPASTFGSVGDFFFVTG